MIAENRKKYEDVKVQAKMIRKLKSNSQSDWASVNKSLRLIVTGDKSKFLNTEFFQSRQIDMSGGGG